MTGWNNTGYNDKEWQKVIEKEYPKNNLIATYNEPVRMHETFRPVRVFKTPKGEQVIDFGQNLVGQEIIFVEGKPGDTIYTVAPGVRVGVADGAFRQLRERRAVPLRYYGARRIDQLRRDDVSRTGIWPGVDVGVERHAAVACELRVRQRDVVLVEVHARVQRRENRAEQHVVGEQCEGDAHAAEPQRELRHHVTRQGAAGDPVEPRRALRPSRRSHIALVERPGAAAGEKHRAAHGDARYRHGPFVEAGRAHPAEDHHEDDVETEARDGRGARRKPEHEPEPHGELGDRPQPNRGDDEVGMAQRPLDRALHPQRAGERVRELGRNEARRIEVELQCFVDAVDGVEVVDQPPRRAAPEDEALREARAEQDERCERQAGRRAAPLDRACLRHGMSLSAGIVIGSDATLRTMR